MTAYYNEWDPQAAAWLRELIRRGLVAPGDVDERSITEVTVDDLKGYKQWHFFAGIGGWSRALRLAGWPDDRPVCSGSPPCQPFSAAGRLRGVADERHLAPVWLELVAALRPPVVVGEQVAGAIKKDDWLDDLLDALEREGYSTGAAVLPACSVGAPHIRQRLWFVARRDWERVQYTADCDPDGDGWWLVTDVPVDECDCIGPTQDGVEYREIDGGLFGRLVDSEQQGLEGHAGDGGDCDEPRREQADAARSAAEAGWPDWLADADGRERWRSGAVQPGGEHGRIAEDGSGFGQANSGPRAKVARKLDRPSPHQAGWNDPDWLFCRDGKWRPVESGTFPLADGVSARVGRLRGYGNAIVPQVAAEVIRCIMDQEWFLFYNQQETT